MRKPKFVTFSLLLGTLCFTSCKKQHAEEDNALSNLICEAKIHFETNENQSLLGSWAEVKANQQRLPRRYVSHWPRWEDAVAKPLFKGGVVIVPIEYSNPFLLTSSLSRSYSYSINTTRKLFIYKDEKGDFQTQAVTYMPDSAFLKGDKYKFSGLIVIEDWNGKLINLYLVEPNGLIKKGISNSEKLSKDSQARLQESATTICIYAEGYNYSADDPEGVYWTELIRCETFYPSSPETGTSPGGSGYAASGGGGGSFYPTYNTFSVYSPDNPIGDAKDYLKCFINAPGNDHHYQIALCVSQPEPGVRTAWETKNPFDNAVYVGHTYLIMTEVTPTRTVVRNVGFYPLNGAKPYSPSDIGALNNDQLRSYDIKLTINMTSSQFFNVLDYIKQSANIGLQYNLNTNNCTTFAIRALNSAGFNIPATTGTWHNGQGLNPGDLGEDIREMTLTSNMTRTTIYGTHPNKGSCHPIE